MLPPKLQQLKDYIESRDWQIEDAEVLLSELQRLDYSLEMIQRLSENLINKGELPMVVSGPGGCPCCGR